MRQYLHSRGRGQMAVQRSGLFRHSVHAAFGVAQDDSMELSALAKKTRNWDYRRGVGSPILRSNTISFLGGLEHYKICLPFAFSTHCLNCLSQLSFYRFATSLHHVSRLHFPACTLLSTCGHLIMKWPVSLQLLQVRSMHDGLPDGWEGGGRKNERVEIGKGIFAVRVVAFPCFIAAASSAANFYQLTSHLSICFHVCTWFFKIWQLSSKSWILVMQRFPSRIACHKLLNKIFWAVLQQRHPVNEKWNRIVLTHA
jgi:hypothetical protein